MKHNIDGSLKNLASLYQNVAAFSNDTVLNSQKAFKIITVSNSSWPNSVFDIETTLTQNDVKSIEDYLMVNNNSSIAIIDSISDNYLAFKNHKFFPAGKWKAMVLKGFKKIKTTDLAKEYEVTVVSENEIVSWGAVISEVLLKDSPISKSILTGLRNTSNELIMLKWNKKILGTTLIHFDSEDVAGIYFVCILPEYQGKGLGKALVTYCLKRIEEKGVDTCYLQATTSGVPLYKSLGFEDLNDIYLYYKIK